MDVFAPNLYDVLEVAPTCPMKEVQDAYQCRVAGLESTLTPKKLRRCPPPDLSECLLRVTAAYRILFDEVDRAAHNVWAGVDAVWTEDAGRVDGNLGPQRRIRVRTRM